MSITIAIVLAILGGGGGGAVLVKILSRPVDSATVSKLKAEAKQTAQETAASEVALLREIIKEVRDSESKKVDRITRLEEINDSIRERLDKLEDRERHMLTRAAVHEAWDVLSFQMLIANHPDHPSPPPLTPPDYDH